VIGGHCNHSASILIDLAAEPQKSGPGTSATGVCVCVCVCYSVVQQNVEMERYCIFDVSLLTDVYTETHKIDLIPNTGYNNTANSERDRDSPASPDSSNIVITSSHEPGNIRKSIITALYSE